MYESRRSKSEGSSGNEIFYSCAALVGNWTDRGARHCVPAWVIMTAVMEGLIRTTLTLLDPVPGHRNFLRFVRLSYACKLDFTCRAPTHSSISQSSSVSVVFSQSMISINLSFPSAFRPSCLLFRSSYLRPLDNRMSISRLLYPIRQEALFLQSYTVLIIYSLVHGQKVVINELTC